MLKASRRCAGKELKTQLVLAFVSSRLDYCSSVLSALRQSTIEPRQRVQNAAARLIFSLGRKKTRYAMLNSAALADSAVSNHVQALYYDA